jgi:hypothetical protein
MTSLGSDLTLIKGLKWLIPPTLLQPDRNRAISYGARQVADARNRLRREGRAVLEVVLANADGVLSAPAIPAVEHPS